MDSEKTSPSCYPHNQKGSLLAKATGAVGGYSKAAKAAAAALRRAAGGAASAAAAASRHAERAGADPRMLFGEIELTPMGGAAAAPRISSGGAPAGADQHVAASMLLCEPAGGAPAGADQHVAARMLLDVPAGGALAGADQHVAGLFDELGEPAGGTLLDSVPMLRARKRQSALRVLSAFRARERDGEKPMLQVSPPYVPTWVELTPRVSEEVEPLPRSAWLPRTFPDGLKPLPIERIVEKPPRTVRDLLPRGAPLERDGTWQMPNNWPHFIDGAPGAALMTRDSDAFEMVGADAPIFVRRCFKCCKSVDTRCEPCSGDAYGKWTFIATCACTQSAAPFWSPAPRAMRCACRHPLQNNAPTACASRTPSASCASALGALSRRLGASRRQL